MTEKFYPSETNLGKNCKFWDFAVSFSGCNFPRVQMEGRTSCEGVIDEVCLYLKDGRRPAEASFDIDALKLQPPKPGQKPEIPS